MICVPFVEWEANILPHSILRLDTAELLPFISTEEEVILYRESTSNSTDLFAALNHVFPNLNNLFERTDCSIKLSPRFAIRFRTRIFPIQTYLFPRIPRFWQPCPMTDIVIDRDIP